MEVHSTPSKRYQQLGPENRVTLTFLVEEE